MVILWTLFLKFGERFGFGMIILAGFVVILMPLIGTGGFVVFEQDCDLRDQEAVV